MSDPRRPAPVPSQPAGAGAPPPGVAVPPRRRGRWWLVGCLVPALVLVLVVATLTVLSVRSRSALIEHVRADAQAGLAASQPAFDHWRGEVAGALGEPLGSRRLLTCRIHDPDDFGFTADTWFQTCRLSSVDVFAVAAEADAADIQRAVAVRGLEGLVGPRTAATGAGCPQLFGSGSGTGDDLRSASYQQSTRHCLNPAPQGAGVRVLSDMDPAALPTGSGWLVVTRDQVVSHTELGCRRIVVCLSPLRGPVLP